MQLVIFTDLDGTLLDKQTYSYEEALPALNEVIKRNIPLVFCTSKTFTESDHYAKEIGINEPLIVENGGGIFIPEGYFPFRIPHSAKRNEYIVVEIGTRYEKLRKAVREIRKRGIPILGFGDMTESEISENANLPLGKARMAKLRDYDEPFIVAPEHVNEAKKIIEKMGLRYDRGGRFSHITGNNDKGKAVDILKSLYKRKFGKIITIGLGDSENDIPMLKRVDRPFMLKSGPSEWNRIVLREIGSLK